MLCYGLLHWFFAIRNDALSSSSVLELPSRKRHHLISKSNIRLINSLALAKGKPQAITTRAPAVCKLVRTSTNNSHSQDIYRILSLMQKIHYAAEFTQHQRLCLIFGMKGRNKQRLNGSSQTLFGSKRY